MSVRFSDHDERIEALWNKTILVIGHICKGTARWHFDTGRCSYVTADDLREIANKMDELNLTTGSNDATNC